LVFAMSGKLDLRQESFRLLGSLGRRRLAALGEVLLAVSVETPVESIAFSAIDGMRTPLLLTARPLRVLPVHFVPDLCFGFAPLGTHHPFTDGRFVCCDVFINRFIAHRPSVLADKRVVHRFEPVYTPPISPTTEPTHDHPTRRLQLRPASPYH